MDAPTEWTYGGEVDWSSPDTLRLLPVEYVLRPIIEAVKERHRPDYYYSGLDSVLEYAPLRPLGYYVRTINNILMSLIGNFYYNGKGGYVSEFPDNWNGRATSIPVWSHASLLQYLNYEKRFSVFSNFAEWAFQTYKMLNMLRHYKYTIFLNYYGLLTNAHNAITFYGWRYKIMDCIYEKDMNKSAACQKAVNDWNNKAWEYSSGVSSSDWYQTAYASPHDQGNGETRWQINLKTRESAFKFSNSSDILCSVDYYVYPHVDLNGYLNPFNANGLICEEYNLVNSYSEAASENIIETDYILTAPVDPAIIPENTISGFILGTPIGFGFVQPLLDNINRDVVVFVAKYDGPNGFKFRSW